MMHVSGGDVLLFPVVRNERAEAIFGPEDISLMLSALKESWAALAFVEWNGKNDMDATRERLARSILRSVALGERRIQVLSGYALGAIEPRHAGGQSWHVSKSVS